LGNTTLRQRFGVPSERVGLWIDETIQALRALWRGEPGFQGEQVTVEGSLIVQPAQPGGVPIWVGGTARAAVERAARIGDAYYAGTNHPIEGVLRRIAAYRALTAELGRSGETVGLTRLALLADSEQQARELAARYLSPILRWYAEFAQPGPMREHLQQGTQGFFERAAEHFALIGTSAQVRQRVEAFKDAGVSHLFLRLRPDGTPPEVAARTIELFGRDVIGALR
jgi:alkanesulfonate monooxygenase SsuD/methylene tetrahydromethanopterin reductase-like flavin-dependent oxidoreductase (luciferase family)